MSARHRGPHAPDATEASAELTSEPAPPPAPRPARCPFCDGTDTALESAFGSTLGLAQYWCSSCRTIFEYLKWEDGGLPATP